MVPAGAMPSFAQGSLGRPRRLLPMSEVARRSACEYVA